MKFSLFLGCGLVSILAVASTLDEGWKNWKSQHEKQYTEDEETYRRMVWENNMRYIEQHNLEYSMGKHTFTVGMNQFGDLTNEEFNELVSGMVQIDADNLTAPEVNERDEINEGEAVDWRKKGLVTPVKNQQQCRASWAFSALGAAEGQWAKAYGRLVSLSEQSLIDCDKGNGGCRGGLLARAFRYLIRRRGINSAEAYPYTGQVGFCRHHRTKIVARIIDYRRVREGEINLAKAVRDVGPISVVIYSGLKTFQFYEQGVYYDQDCKHPANHAVLTVGFGTENGMNYWLVKNSWGTSWGEKGYIRMSKDKGNNCGIASYMFYPIV
ncbi:procathepsin L-like [Stegostoma tigrinum]|uniref:procathepsin L-like n=1 Tax=Stegostoma tigrinum TaxID=3053191 RepID=UPI00286FCFDA|nr:procathepsin L-like [Stegostoma tigrinum]